MAHGVMTIADNREEAENSIGKVTPQLRILSSRELDLSGLPPLAAGPLPRHWVVVVEHPDPAVEAKFEQEADPEEACERSTRLMYLKMATNPDLLVTGSLERFTCPACAKQIQVKLPKAKRSAVSRHANCPECRTPLRRAHGRYNWQPVRRATKQPPPCVFCGEKANSLEHVIPAWISRRLKIKEFLSAEDAFVGGDIARRKQPISFASYRARILCSDCNAHFGSGLEEVIPLLVPMAKGQVLSVDPDTQALLALWASKTAMMLLAATPEQSDSVPEEHKTNVRNGELSPNTWIGYFPWDGGPVLGTGSGLAISNEDPNLQHDLYMAFLTFGQIGFCVYGVLDSIRHDEILDVAPGWIQQFWPTQRPLIHWPPGPRVTNQIIPQLLNLAPIRTAP